MVGRAGTNRAERRSEDSSSLPIFDRLAPSAPIADIVSQIEAWTKPGEVVLDLNGRGGWVARAAIAGQRRAADLESLSLTRLLADVVVRPPDVRHFEAAAQAISIRPLRDATVKKTIEQLFASTCPVCGRPVVLEALIWEPGAGRGKAGAGGGAAKPGAAAAGAARRAGGAAGERATRREFRCLPCQQQLGGPELRHAEPAAGDLALAAFADLPDAVLDNLRKRFPTPTSTLAAASDQGLPEQLVDLHTARQLLGLNAILEGIELETRSAPLMAALRLAFLHAVGSASRLNSYRGRPSTLRISRGAVRLPAAHAWRERNPWLAFEEGLRTVQSFVARLESDEKRSVAARLASDLLELQGGTSNVVIGESTPGSLRRIGLAGERIAHSGTPSRVRLMVGQAPLRLSRERLAEAYHETAWALGAGAASMLPFEELFRPAPRAARRSSAEDLARAVARSLAIATPALAQNGCAVVLLDDAEPRTLVAAAIGGAAAGCRLIEARLHRNEEDSPALAVFVPPTGVVAPGPRTRANRPLPPVEGGAGDPGTVVGQGVFASPEKLGEGVFRAPAAAQAVNDTAIELLKARGEPACFEHLLGDLLVGLDRSGQLARFARQFRPPRADQGWDAWVDIGDSAAAPDSTATEPPAGDAPPAPGRPTGSKERPGEEVVEDEEPAEASGPVDELLALIRNELDRGSNRRVRQIEPNQYWLGSEEDRFGAAQPLADRVEWAVFSLLSSSRQMTEAAVFERTKGLFQDRDAPDGDLMRACLESYSAPGSTPDAVATADQLERRSAEHDAMIALIADLGHRLGTRVWIGRRQQVRRVDGRQLADRIDMEERDIVPTVIAWGPEAELERVDCAWYVRHKATLLFEVEWTAMLGDPVLVRHSRFPSDDKVVRFLVVPPERAELVRYKLARSPLLRRAFAERNWHVLKWDQLTAFAARTEVSLADLEPYLGLEADAAAGEQLPLFEA
ncbi:MAG: hypothetical protein ABSD62_03615 [Candidatus Limnocylindrales bacterium]|jgi:hypothetical protein